MLHVILDDLGLGIELGDDKINKRICIFKPTKEFINNIL